MQAAVSFFESLENFVAVIAYWGAAFFAVVTVEHVVFRRGRVGAYDLGAWNRGDALPSGIAAMGAGVLSFALVVPCMKQTWFVGPIAEKTGDIGFLVALGVCTCLYLPFRALEIRVRKRL